MTSITSSKKKIISDIKNLITPYLKPTEFNESGKPVFIFISKSKIFQKDKNGKYFYELNFDNDLIKDKNYSLTNDNLFKKDLSNKCFLLKDFIGFTENGILTGFSTNYILRQEFFEDFPFEDLQVLLKWTKSYFKNK